MSLYITSFWCMTECGGSKTSNSNFLPNRSTFTSFREAINPLQAGVAFLYPLKTSEKT